MQIVNNNTPEQINSALFAIGDDITKQNVQTKNALKTSESALQKQIDKLTDSLQNNGGLIIGGTYDINISGNASTSTNATNATNADKATHDAAGNVITTTYATKAEVPTKTSELTNDSNFVTSGQLATVATSGNYNDLSNKPTIPTNNNQLTNGAGYITSSGSCNYANSAGSANSAGTATKVEDGNNVVQYKATSLNGFTIQDTQAKALYVEGRESNGGDSGGIAITNDSVTAFGAGDTDGVFRVINEDNVSAGPVFKVMKNGQVYTTNTIHGSIDGSANQATTALKIRTSAPSNPSAGDIWIS